MRTIPAAENGESCLNPVFWPFTNLDQYSFQIRLCQMDISAFSGQNKVTKMCPSIYWLVIINDHLSSKYW